MVLEVVGFDGGHRTGQVLTACGAVTDHHSIVEDLGVGLEDKVENGLARGGLLLVLIADKGCHQNGIRRFDGDRVPPVIICRRSVRGAFLEYIGPRNRLTVTVRHTTGDLNLLRKGSGPRRCEKHQRDKKPFHHLSG